MSHGFEADGCSDSLSRDNETGIWRARQSSPVSYPNDGNASCFRVEDGSFWFRHRNQCIATAVRRWTPSGFILDVGGGNGYVAGGLIEAGHATVLLEPGDEGARNARVVRQIPDVICATLHEAAFKAGTVPAVGLFDVLEHIEDDAGFIGELRRLLAPGGFVYVTVPSHEWLWSTADVDAGHFRRYTCASLVSRFAAAGFDVLFSTYFFEALVLPLFLLRTVPYRLGFRGHLADEAEHATGRGWLSAVLQSMLAREVVAIGNRRSLATGTSCLLVARKAGGATPGMR
jgi:SAM-dependent methyltransferase